MVPPSLTIYLDLSSFQYSYRASMVKHMALEALMKCGEERKSPGQLAVIVLEESEI